MKKILLLVLLVALGSVGAVLAVGSMPSESDVALRLGRDSAAVFLNLRNNGLMPDCVVGVEVEGDVQGKTIPIKAELHKSYLEGNVVRMVKVDRICVGPLSEVKMRGIEGEGYHVMLLQNVEEVELFHIYLKFESGKVLHFHVEQHEGAGSHQHDHKH
ncbi:MAG: copper chaperone PCu(A)C [Candidatus Caldarchaeum sp.]